MRGGGAEPRERGEARASLCPEGVDPGASPNRSRVLAAAASSGRGPAGSPPADSRADRQRAAGKELPWIRLELLDPALSPAASRLGGEVSQREGTEPS